MGQNQSQNRLQAYIHSLGESKSAVALIISNVLLAGSYWAVAVFVRWYFSKYQMWPAPMWLSAGIAMFAALVLGRRAAIGIFLGSFLTNMVSFHGHLLTGWIVALGNTLAPVVAIAVVRKHVRISQPFSSTRDVFWFTFGCFLNGTISGVFGSTGYQIGSGANFSQWTARWISWMLSDASASLLLVPLFLFLIDGPPPLGQVRKRPLEFLATMVVSVSTVAYVLSMRTGHMAVDAGSSFLILIPLLWAAVRFSPRFAYSLFVALMTMLVAGTLAGYGLYASASQNGKFLVFSQMSIGFGIAVLLLGAVSAEHHAALRALRQLNEELELRIEHRTSELRESKQQLEKVAFHDPLTGLPNRRFLEDQFAVALASAARKNGKVTFLLIDLDHFKQINDTLGHDAGDAFLIETARRISIAVRSYDFVARLGGDEFAVLLMDMPEPGQVELICRRVIESVQQPLPFNAKILETSSSLGISVYPDHGANWHELYKSADIALYSAKQNGRGRFQWYERPSEPSFQPSDTVIPSSPRNE